MARRSAGAYSPCYREQRTHLGRHDRGGQALGIGRQPGGFQVGGDDMRLRVTCRWSLVRCVHARYHIPVEFVDLL